MPRSGQFEDRCLWKRSRRCRGSLFLNPFRELFCAVSSEDQELKDRRTDEHHLQRPRKGPWKTILAAFRSFGIKRDSRRDSKALKKRFGKCSLYDAAFLCEEERRLVMDPGDGMTGTSVNIQNKVQCLGAVMKPCDCNLRDSQLRQVMDEFPILAGFNY